MEFYWVEFLIIFIAGVLMSFRLEFYCRWGSTVEFLYIFKKY